MVLVVPQGAAVLVEVQVAQADLVRVELVARAPEGSVDLVQADLAEVLVAVQVVLQAVVLVVRAVLQVVVPVVAQVLVLARLIAGRGVALRKRMVCV